MLQKAIWFFATVSCAAAMLLWTAQHSEAGPGGGHGGGGHGGGGHGGGLQGGGFHSGGFHADGWHGGGRAWSGHGWNNHAGSWRGHHGYYGGYYGGYYPGLYGVWDYPSLSYGYPDYSYSGYSGSDYPIYGNNDSYYDPMPATGSGAATFYGAAAPSAATDNTAYLSVRVPPQAQVWFENTATVQRGAVRNFQSPALTPGQNYTYDIRARWRDGDHEVDQTRHVTVHANSHVTVDFSAPASGQPQAPAAAGRSES